MKLIVVLLVLTVEAVRSFGIADLISNYARVAVNNGTSPNASLSSTLEPKSNISALTNDTESDSDDDYEYEDFDEVTETSVERKTSSFDPGTMMSYLNGVVSLLALMYKFSGKPVNPQSLHFGGSPSPSKPQNAPRGNLAESINSIAEDRYQPSTAHKKFKQKEQQSFTANDAYSYTKSKAESYGSGGDASSYDADANQYMIKNPEKPNNDDAVLSYSMLKDSPPMKDYMSQNGDVDIQQSYSYQLPQDLPKKVMKPGKPISQAYGYPDHAGADGGNDHGDVDIQQSYSYQPPQDMPKKAMKPGKPIMSQASGYPDHAGADEGNDHGPLYYPWMTKPMRDPSDDDDMGDHDDSQPPDSPVYYPWMSKPNMKKPKPPPPSPPMDDHDIPEDDSPPPWAMSNKPSGGGKSKYPSPPDDHPVYYQYWPQLDHDHGYIDDHQEGDDHDHHGDHHDDDHHDMHKDEDRESKRPYTYYHLGRKLWYVPLLFSLYFIVYIGALILKSIARHKVQFPEKLWDLHHEHDHHHDERSRRGRKIEETTERVMTSLERMENKFM